ncbi:hypothetical protein ACFQX7_00590 [Luedemannella flava]
MIRQAERRVQLGGVEEGVDLGDPAVDDLEDLQRPGPGPPSGSGRYCPKAGAPFADVGTRREPRHSAPGPSRNRPMLSAPRNHSAYGGMAWIASSCSSVTRVSMS